MINNSKNIYFFIGLPGSGKTYTAKSLIDCLENNLKNNVKNNLSENSHSSSYSPIMFVDDLYIQLKEHQFDWHKVFKKNLGADLKIYNRDNDINNHANNINIKNFKDPNFKDPYYIVITDFLACDPKQQLFIYQKLKELFPQHKQNWYFFENDKEKCLNNIQHRNNGKHVHITLSQMHKVYGIDPQLYHFLDSLSQIPVFSPSINHNNNIIHNNSIHNNSIHNNLKVINKLK